MNPQGQRGRHDQRQDEGWERSDRDRSQYGSHRSDRTQVGQGQAAYQGSSFQADRDAGGGYGGSSRSRDQQYRDDYRSHGDLQRQGGYRRDYEEQYSADQRDQRDQRDQWMSGDYGSRWGSGQDQRGSSGYRDQGPRHEGWREDSARSDFSRSDRHDADSYADSLHEHYGSGSAGRYGGQAGGGSASSSWQSQARQGHHDPDYDRWRTEQMRALDADYHGWRQERYQKFSDDFNKWRSERASRPSQERGSAPLFGAQDTSDSTRYGQGGNRMGGTTGTHDDQNAGLSVSGTQSTESSGTTPSPATSGSGVSGTTGLSGSGSATAGKK